MIPSCGSETAARVATSIDVNRVSPKPDPLVRAESRCLSSQSPNVKMAGHRSSARKTLGSLAEVHAEMTNSGFYG
jgi:hypothetical protein